MHFSSFCCPIWIIFLKYLVLWKVFTTFQGLLFFPSVLLSEKNLIIRSQHRCPKMSLRELFCGFTDKKQQKLIK